MRRLLVLALLLPVLLAPAPARAETIPRAYLPRVTTGEPWWMAWERDCMRTTPGPWCFVTIPPLTTPSPPR